MSGRFALGNDKATLLSATRQGRVSVAGFTYQAGFAVARLASMAVRQPILDLPEVPQVIRYDWAEDVDEVDTEGCTTFTQCKRVDEIGQPSKLADVLLAFAPKFLWTSPDRRNAVRFRLVSTDSRLRGDGSSMCLTTMHVDRSKACAAAVARLATTPASGSDRALWQRDADAFGLEALVDAIWQRSDGLFLPGDALQGDPCGLPLLTAESEALDLLVRWREIDVQHRAGALLALRQLVHNNLVTFDPASTADAAIPRDAPRLIHRADVLAALFLFRSSQERTQLFRAIGQQFLVTQSERQKEPYVARPPEWADVVHGENSEVRFVERDFTSTILERIRSHILTPILSGNDSRLRAVVILGAPGAGKSTVVRRVAALLVKEGLVIVADPGLNLLALESQAIEQVISDLRHLGSAGRPILLVLDDPFFADSGWDRLLTKLAGACPNAGVVCASPDFLFAKYGDCLRRGQVETDVFTLPSPSERERQTIARLHGRSPEIVASKDLDFLVLSMEAAANESFADIISRIWITLNDGTPVNVFTKPGALPWQVRAYLLACFFHRAYERCPTRLLKEALSVSGAVRPGDYDYDLRHLEHSHGWRIFSVQEPSGNIIDRLDGATVATGHHVIAREAWRQRPVPAADVADWIIQASIRCNAPFAVARLAGALASSADPSESSVAARLAQAWCNAGTAVKAESLAGLAATLWMNEAHDAAALLVPALRQRALKATPDSWVAVLQLWHMSFGDPKKNVFPPDVDLDAIIAVADFSIASTRANRFAVALGPKTRQYGAYFERLFMSLDRRVDWELDTNAVTWLLARAPRYLLTADRLQSVRQWLARHPDDNFTRTKFLSVIEKLPEKSALREAVLGEAASWIDEHTEDQSVRTKLLDVVASLPADRELRRSVLCKTAAWIDAHPGASSVRIRFESIE